jgi:hypothetical protein
MVNVYLNIHADADVDEDAVICNIYIHITFR